MSYSARPHTSVIKVENADAEWAQAIVVAYHSEEFATYMEENNDGLWWIPEELQS